jgi:hypothetical protein
VKRLVETTRGWVELDIEKLDRIGVSVRVTVFAESDWASFDKIWFAKVDDQPFARFLSDAADIPVEEAAQIGEESLRLWRERGGPEELAKENAAPASGPCGGPWVARDRHPCADRATPLSLAALN